MPPADVSNHIIRRRFAAAYFPQGMPGGIAAGGGQSRKSFGFPNTLRENRDRCTLIRKTCAPVMEFSDYAGAPPSSARKRMQRSFRHSVRSAFQSRALWGGNREARSR